MTVTSGPAQAPFGGVGAGGAPGAGPVGGPGLRAGAAGRGCGLRLGAWRSPMVVSDRDTGLVSICLAVARAGSGFSGSFVSGPWQWVSYCQPQAQAEVGVYAATRKGT